jgi:hypothetical protein
MAARMAERILMFAPRHKEKYQRHPHALGGALLISSYLKTDE